MTEHKHFKAHPDHEVFDRVEFLTVPRWASGMGGDEWRSSVRAFFWSKGRVILSRDYSSMDAALAHAPWLIRNLDLAFEESGTGTPFGDVMDALCAGELCMQPGCSKKARRVVRLIRQYSKAGEELVERDDDPPAFRAFCVEHSHRGDCGLEDADCNYVSVKR